ncbi:MAG: hypothetical protein HKN19_05285 [Halioglobus sp.]|nr:hypothetical protein [Halioglobus sp.]
MNGNYPTISRSKERGVVMFVSLILLIALTLIVVTSSNIVQANLKVVQNLESREMVRFAAMAALEEAVSSDRFASNPEAMFLESCEVANRKCYDFNGDGVDDITVDMATPACIIVTPIRNDDLDVFNSPEEASCFLPPGVYSMCANSVWELQATARDALTGAEISVRQGVSIQTTLNVIDTACPV